jgi:hypothetical protein
LEVEIIVRRKKNNPWMAGTRPAMTMVESSRRVFPERP